MSTQTLPLTADLPDRRFIVAVVGFVFVAVAITGWLPIGVSILSVFLCAGPHNWVEARYFLSRLPGRWGKLTGFFTLGLGGVAVLTAAFASIHWYGSGASWETMTSIWNTALALWIATLVTMRSRQNPRREWGWIWAVAFGLIALAWLWPFTWSMGLVYLHPLVAFWILDREIGRIAPEYRRTYRALLLLVPFCVAGLCWRLAGAPDLPGEDVLTDQIRRHAGDGILNSEGGLLSGVSTHLLVALHTFLELLHYGVWLVAVPWVARNTSLWKIEQTPLARRGGAWTLGVKMFVAGGVGLVFILWAGFIADYPVTRDIYFTVALAHVLAEVPFLLRAL
jgi:hypothetical protein